MKIAHLAVLSALLASCAAIAASKPAKSAKPPKQGLPRYGMAVFSDLCVNAENGDFGGQRITVQRFAEVDTVIYEFTAGGLSWPVVASDVNIDPRGKMLYFTVQPEAGDERTISGKLADNGNTLVLDGGYCGDPALPTKLKKVTDFGRTMGVCKPCPAPKPAPLEPLEAPLEEPPAPPTDDMPLQEGGLGHAQGA